MSLDARKDARAQEDAMSIARQVIERDAQIQALVRVLRAKDMLGLECAEGVQLESLSAENSAAAQILAQWVLRQLPLNLKPRICLDLTRPNGPPCHVEIGGEQVMPAMLDAAEDLFHTLMTGERSLIKNLYEIAAQAFGTIRDDAKGRLLFAMYGGKNVPVPSPPEEPSPNAGEAPSVKDPIPPTLEEPPA